jgi:urease subunit gamma/beta
VVRGGNALGSGKVSPEGRERAMDAVRAQGFGHQEEGS